MHFEFEHLVDAPPDRVFEFFAEPRNRPLWQRSLRRVEVLTPGATRLGTTWHEWPFGVGPVAMEITQFDPPQEWAERGNSPFGRLDLRLAFEAANRQTRVRVDAELALPRILRLGAPLGRRLLLHEMRKDVAKAAGIIEGRAASAP